jgi:hypothetical protein
MANEQPRAPRFSVGGLRVIYDTGDGYWSAPVIDVSETGLFVETTHELPPGKEVVIIPDLDEGSEEHLPFEIRGVVVRNNEYDLDEHWDRTPGIAFSLANMSSEHIEQLQAFLAAHGVPVRGRRP